jgi:hypothetical protein
MNIKELAGQANERFELFWPGGAIWYWDELAKFAELIAAHKREECAKLCDRFQARDVGMQPAECAGAIRARSKA